MVSNRGPIGYVREGGERVARRGAGGLVTALAPLVSHHDVTWIASALSDEDRVVADRRAGRGHRSRRLAVPAEARRARPRCATTSTTTWSPIRRCGSFSTACGSSSTSPSATSRRPGKRVRRGQQRLRRGGRRGAGPRSRHCCLLPRLPPVPRAEARPGAAARGSDRALHTHPVGGAEGWSVLPDEIVRAIHGACSAATSSASTRIDGARLSDRCAVSWASTSATRS